MQKILVIDTSMLCVKLNVPGKETCGPDDDRWDQQRVEQKLQQEEAMGTIFVLPLAVIIETGNHIAQAPARRYEIAQAFRQIMLAAADEQSPWTAFARQRDLWNAESITQLANEFPDGASQQRSMGDMTIVRVAEYYHRVFRNYQVEIFTADAQLRAYEPPQPSVQPPRRRQ